MGDEAALHYVGEFASQSDTGDIDYGSEIDLDVSLPLDEHVTLGLRFAQFDMEDAFADTAKVMAWVSLTP